MSSTTHTASSIAAADPDTGSSAPVGVLPLQLDVGYRPGEVATQACLVQARLGAGSSLFTALRCKHSPTAAHSLRVALSCSAWGMAVDLDPELLSDLEVAALLHDIGKIGVPDAVLLKPGKLDECETETVRGHQAMGLEILKSFGAPSAVREIIRYAPAWYASEVDHVPPHGNGLPLGARMLSIADAFDSMTHQQVYRDAMGRSKALERLVEAAGSQFDPYLLREFFDVEQADSVELHAAAARRWLRHLASETSAGDRQLSAPGFPAAAESLAPLFLEKLIGSMRDGVVCVDSQLHVQLWNRGAEVLSGVPAEEVTHQRWQPRLLKLRDEDGRAITEEDCPVRQVVLSSVQSIRRVQIQGRTPQPVAIDLHIVPVIGPEGQTRGANIFMRDVTSETSLEARCATLHEKATRDPLTQLANRAEFDRQHQPFIERHLERNEPGSLIICDIDHFKKINDTYGHPAGDAALRSFAELLSANCRPGDLVARYGGEEFVLLCTDCDQLAASERAEKIRRELGDMPLESLSGKRITASFGVTETAKKDTATAMLCRADQALLEAKSAGRNMVVTVNPDGIGRKSHGEGGWFNWWKPSRSMPVARAQLVSKVPLRVAVEKLRGFVTEYQTQAKAIDENHVVLRFEPEGNGLLRRESDRGVAFVLELGFYEEKTVGPTLPGRVRTRVEVAVRPRRDRDRRRSDVVERARTVIGYLQTYLITSEPGTDDEPVEPCGTTLAGTWLAE